MTEKIIILDFGSQYTQLIARKVRECNVYCEILPYHNTFQDSGDIKGIILSGSPFSVNDSNAPDIDLWSLTHKYPILGICYGAQLTAKKMGGRVEKSEKREYGRAILHKQKEDILFKNISPAGQVWMSHGDSIIDLPPGFQIIAVTESIPVAGFKADTAQFIHPLYGLQFHQIGRAHV